MTSLHSVSVLVVDGFPSPGPQGELLGEGGGHFRLGAEQHFRLETCLPEIRDQLAEDNEGDHSQPDTRCSHPRPRPPPPPKPANISAKLLELRRLASAESAQLKYETRSYNSAAVRGGGDSNNNTTTVNCNNSSSNNVVSLAISSSAEAGEDSLLLLDTRAEDSVRSAAPCSRIPTLAACPRPAPAPAPGSPAHKCDNHLNHKVYLTIEPGKVATKRRPSHGGDPRPGTPHQPRSGPASLIPRPRAATPQQLSGRGTPSLGHLGSSTASLSGRATPTSSSARATPTPRPRPPSRRGSQLSLGPRSVSGSRIPVSTARHSSLDTAEVDSGVWNTRYLYISRYHNNKISG